MANTISSFNRGLGVLVFAFGGLAFVGPAQAHSVTVHKPSGKVVTVEHVHKPKTHVTVVHHGHHHHGHRHVWWPRRAARRALIHHYRWH